MTAGCCCRAARGCCGLGGAGCRSAHCPCARQPLSSSSLHTTGMHSTANGPGCWADLQLEGVGEGARTREALVQERRRGLAAHGVGLRERAPTAQALPLSPDHGAVSAAQACSGQAGGRAALSLPGLLPAGSLPVSSSELVLRSLDAHSVDWARRDDECPEEVWEASHRSCRRMGHICGQQGI